MFKIKQTFSSFREIKIPSWTTSKVTILKHNLIYTIVSLSINDQLKCKYENEIFRFV